MRLSRYRLHGNIGTITMITAWLLLIYFLIISLYPFTPLEVKGITLNNNQVKRGDYLHYTIDYCKYMDEPALIRRQFLNDIIYEAPTITTDVEVGCKKGLGSVYIPQHLPQGTYRLRWISTYTIANFRDIIVKYQTDKFEVIE